MPLLLGYAAAEEATAIFIVRRELRADIVVVLVVVGRGQLRAGFGVIVLVGLVPYGCVMPTGAVAAAQLCGLVDLVCEVIPR